MCDLCAFFHHQIYYIAEQKGSSAFASSFIPEASTIRIPVSNQGANPPYDLLRRRPRIHSRRALCRT